MRKIIGIFLLISSLSFSDGNYYSSEKIIWDRASKYQSQVTMDLIDGEFPTNAQLERIFAEIKNKNKGDRNYFVQVYFPIKANSDDAFLLYLMSQIKNEKLEIRSFWENIQYSEMVVRDKYKNKIGAVNYNELIALKKGVDIGEIISKYGEPFDLSDDVYSYLLLSRGNKIIATLYLIVKNNKLESLSTYSIDKSINKKELDSLLEGKIKKPKLNIRQLSQ